MPYTLWDVALVLRTPGVTHHRLCLLYHHPWYLNVMHHHTTSYVHTSLKKGMPLTAPARMQRYALFLGGHSYKNECKRTTNHGHADGASWRKENYLPV
ncbi:uncharacterized protein LOC134354337 isoform X2 [Mobula hypostoma]|uniref:uncharacterized protein LOC134354337 isoform X2 n=1 Tax=Mobula hypostoma TaxID=723540 RepID=UPI002FC2BC6F